jgi:CRISPR/Cas system CSM-associated protein Csm3 (group 7 of RAMP superfamily)
MTGRYDGRYCARVTVEVTTPFLVASGESSLALDATPVTDANGLPAIPGSSLAGVLRHAFTEAHGEARANEIFGSAAALGGENEGSGSRLWITWAHVHDQHDRPVDGLLLEPRPADPVLENASALSLRDHVRIGHRGAGERHGKFDQSVVPAGHRFTFDMTLESAADELAPGGSDTRDFQWLLSYLASGRARIGGSGRRGLGAFRVERCSSRVFDLRREADAVLFAELPVRLDGPAPQLDEASPPPLPEDSDWRSVTLELEPEDYWAFHGEEPWLLDGEERTPDFNPVREERIVWDAGRGHVSPPRLLVPGSGLKGPIAHRVAFHANLHAGHTAQEAGTPEELASWVGSANPAVLELFGAVHESREDGAEPEPPASQAGRVFIDDAWLDPATESRLQRITHNSIDRFTGGTRSGVLFEERVVYRGPTLPVRLEIHRFEELTPLARTALREALRDLAEGRLALGAGGGRGHGYFRSVAPFEDVWRALDPAPSGGGS